MQDEHDEEDIHTREVYAHFGLAYYLAGVLESGLALALLQVEFLTQQKAAIVREGRRHFDRARFERDFDDYLHGQHALTLGNLIKRIQQLSNTPDDLKADLLCAKQTRDFVAHHFFRERAEEFMTKRGRDQMIAELRQAQALFNAVDERLSQFMRPIREKIGMVDEILEPHIDRYIRSVLNSE
jgi:hypothetical protein